MLIGRAELAGITSGAVTLAFRRWVRPTVRSGGTLRTAVGVLVIDAVDVVERDQITDDDARRAGFAGREALLAGLDARTEGRIHRIALRPAGPDPRVALRERGDLTAAESAGVLTRLAAMDGRSRRGPWTLATLRLIDARPEVRAAELAAAAGVETPVFKRQVRRLKELGLTESRGTGYRLSPRGHAVLAAAGSDPRGSLRP